MYTYIVIVVRYLTKKNHPAAKTMTATARQMMASPQPGIGWSAGTWAEVTDVDDVLVVVLIVVLVAVEFAVVVLADTVVDVVVDVDVESPEPSSTKSSASSETSIIISSSSPISNGLQSV